MKVVAAVQARMDSKRLPGKVLADICGAPMIARIHERLSFAKSVDEIVIATTTHASDDVLVGECHRRGFKYVRGPVDKLAVRLFLAGGAFGADVVVRVWGDCPCVDPVAVDSAVGMFGGLCLHHEIVYGCGVQVWDLGTLGHVPASDAQAQLYPYDWYWPKTGGSPIGPALTVDYPDDLERTRRIYEALYTPGAPFSLQDVLALPDSILSIGQHHPRNVEYLEAVS